MTDEQIEQEIQAKGLTAPRLTPEYITNLIKFTQYWVVPNSTTTVCAMTLQNNYVVIGKSASVSMTNFNEELGREIAYANAKEQIWALAGYKLKDDLYTGRPVV